MTARRRLLEGLRPLLRLYLRYGPPGSARRAVWERAVEPYLAWQPHTFRARTTFGAVMRGDTRDILQQYVYYFGLWEPSLTAFTTARLAPGDTFVDVGANVGYYTLLASRCVGATGRVVAIEPSPRLFRKLDSHVSMNACDNVRTLQCAVLDRPGSVQLFHGTEYHSGLTTTRAERGLEFECEVPADRLDALLEEAEIRTARLIKIDIEGAEGTVVSTLDSLLTRARDDLEVIVEIDAELLAGQGQRADDLVERFREAGFHPYQLENDYSSARYVERRPPTPPRRMRGPLAGVCDVVFSRTDAEVLT
jgi:FkbM family methyltransferase